MPVESHLARACRAWRRVVSALVTMAALIVTSGATAACDTAADAGQSAGSHELIDDVAARLAAADSQNYTAVYAMSDAASATITHSASPARSAFTFPTGMIIVEGPQVIQCIVPARRATCTVVLAALPSAVDAAIEHGGLIQPDTVITLLTEATLDANAVVSESDTTLAGTTATCVAITGAVNVHTFSMCVTGAGLLGSFEGDAGSMHVDIELANFTPDVAPTAFTPPAGAKIVKAATTP